MQVFVAWKWMWDQARWVDLLINFWTRNFSWNFTHFQSYLDGIPCLSNPSAGLQHHPGRLAYNWRYWGGRWHLGVGVAFQLHLSPPAWSCTCSASGSPSPTSSWLHSMGGNDSCSLVKGWWIHLPRRNARGNGDKAGELFYCSRLLFEHYIEFIHLPLAFLPCQPWIPDFQCWVPSSMHPVSCLIYLLPIIKD